MSWYTSKKLWSAIGGAAATIIVQQLAKTPCIRKAAVTVASKAIITKENADAALQSFKDDTEDLCADAREDARIKAEAAEVEARIRAEVEAELAQEKTEE